MKNILKNIMGSKLFRYIYYELLPFSLQGYISRLIFRPHFGSHFTENRGTKFFYGNVSFGNGCRIARDSIFLDVEVGNYTIFAEHFRMLGFVHIYSSFSVSNLIEDNLKCCLKKKDLSQIKNRPRIEQYPRTHIGSDVWIGEFVTVKSGVKIGDGAVIAAGSIVTHDVEPFSIVGGVPARFIKWRFDKEKIELMKKIKWWDWPDEKIAENYERLCNFDQSLIDENYNE